MSQHHPDTPDREGDVARLLAGLGDVPADPDFRARLRETFVSGESDRVRKPRPLWWLTAAAATILVLVLGRRFLAPEAPRLEVEHVSGTGSLTVDGRPVSLADARALVESLVAGATVEVPAAASLALILDGSVALEIAGGSRLVLPAPPSAEGTDDPWRLEFGELRLRTGPRFQGSRFLVQTPEAQVVVTGSLLSVQCDQAGTCVCVLEGRVQVGRGVADLEFIPPGQRKVLPREGGAQIVPVAPPHQAGVEEFDARVQGRLPAH